MSDRKDDCCVVIGQRVATLEANNLTLAKTLDKVVTDLGNIVLTLAERRGIEKLLFGVGGCLFTLVGWVVEHISHLGR